MTTAARWILVVVGFTGALLSSFRFFEIVRILRENQLTDGTDVGLRDHYLQVGSFYSRGFTTGFFLCFSLMLVAIAVGTWWDDRLKLRRQEAAAGSAALAQAPPPAIEG